MSLIRQVWLLLLATVLLAFAGGVLVSIDAARDTLETQLRLKNSDNATALALVLSQQRGDRASMELVVAAQFDTGYFQRIAFVPADGSPALARESRSSPLEAPEWFVRWLPIDSTTGVAQVSDGWRALGAVQVTSHSAYAHDELWRGTMRSAIGLATVGALAALAAMLMLQRVRRPLDAAVEQARALERGEYVSVAEPRVPELRRLTRTMNSMVARLKQVFEGHAQQVEALRRQVNCDPLTGLANRAHFLAQLDASLHAEDRQAARGLILLRVVQLAELNRGVGRAGTDRILRAIADVLQEYARRLPGCLAGRLNGSDFAVALPAVGVAGETASTLVGLLRAALSALGASASVVAGAVEVGAGAKTSDLLAAADLALARAEGGVPFTVETAELGEAGGHGQGEAEWRRRLHEALVAGRVELAQFDVVDRNGGLVHFEVPLRVRIHEDGAAEVASRWLPLALRSRLTAALDERAVTLALAAIASDGQPRGVNIAPASLEDPHFAARLRRHAEAAPREAARLWVEVAEAAATSDFDAVRELARVLRPLQVRVGLEHAGERLTAIEGLFDLGIDYVKLDTAVCRGVADDEGRAALVRGLVSLLHGLALQVFAEGVSDAGDAQTLWGCGIDGITGPWVTARRET